MVVFGQVCLLVADLLNYVDTGARAWQSRDLGLEVAFLGPCLAHLIFSQWLFIIHVEFIVSLPQPVHACFVSFAEILLRLQFLGRIFGLATEHVSVDANLCG